MSAKRKPAKPALGQHLEWHGAKIRAVVRVPPSLKDVLGNKLRKSLNTGDPRLAEVLKLSAIQDMKATIYRAKNGTKADPLIQEALSWRRGLDKAKQLPAPDEPDEQPYHVTLEVAADEVADGIRASEGDARADLFLGVALGEEHPIALFLDDWIAVADFAPRTEEARRQAVRKLEEWCKASGDIRPVLEAITPRVAARFVEEVLERPRVHSATANKLLSGLRTYWAWLREKHRLDRDTYPNPWTGVRVKREKAHRSEHDTTKRPFTDAEVGKLLAGVAVQPTADMMRLSLASGMRLSELASLRVSDVQDGMIRVRVGKTEAGRRTFPAPQSAKDILGRRMEDKNPASYLFDDLPEQSDNRRGRGAPVSQAFTRERRSLGVDDVPPGATQSRVDFHSCRRWLVIPPF